MPPRACIDCDAPAVQGRSRCSTHGRSTPAGPRLHDKRHDQLAKQVKREDPPVCAICGLPPTPTDPLEAGHIVPLSQGGESIRSNYRLEHRSHNRAEGARLARRRRFPFFPDR